MDSPEVYVIVVSQRGASHTGSAEPNRGAPLAQSARCERFLERGWSTNRREQRLRHSSRWAFGCVTRVSTFRCGPHSPLTVWMSEWQMPAYWISLRTSLGPTSRRSMVVEASGWPEGLRGRW